MLVSNWPIANIVLPDIRTINASRMALERLLPDLHDTTVVAIVGGEEAPEVRARMLFSVDEKVLCFHVGLLYEAKVST